MDQVDEGLEQHPRIQDVATRARPPRLLISLLVVVALVALTVVEAPSASLRILWRFAVLSFDHPSTQILDEVACESLAPSGARTEGQFTRLVPSGRFVPASEPSRLVSPGLSSGITRSPPAA